MSDASTTLVYHAISPTVLLYYYLSKLQRNNVDLIFKGMIVIENFVKFEFSDSANLLLN